MVSVRLITVLLQQTYLITLEQLRIHGRAQPIQHGHGIVLKRQAVLSSGDYKVVASDATTGVEIDSTEITITTLPSISIVNTSNPVTCFGDDDGDLMFEIYGGNPLGGSQYTYYVDYLQSMAQATGVVLPSNGYWFDSTTQAVTEPTNTMPIIGTEIRFIKENIT
jgi:hypothetical protein